MSNLVLDSLEIKNFRAFKHLRIEKLGRVNLIVGKNNVGKSSALEALWLYVQKGQPSVIWSILGSRDEGLLSVNGQATSLAERLAALKYLFHGRQDVGQHSGPMQVSPANDSANALTIDLARSGTTLSRNHENKWQIKEPEPHYGNLYTHLFVSDGDAAGLFPIVSSPEQSGFLESDYVKAIFTTANGLSRQLMSILWDNVSLTDLENDVIASLRVVAPDVERISLVGGKEPFVQRSPIVKLGNWTNPIPLRSLGEGMNRMFGIALALVNSKDGMLLIDEVDTGLHYSVLPDVWKLIFEVAQRLNVQVFATSHSWDCIQAFQQAADENKEVEGELIRLENRKDGIGAVLFDERDLAIVTREQIEVR